MFLPCFDVICDQGNMESTCFTFQDFPMWLDPVILDTFVVEVQLQQDLSPRVESVSVEPTVQRKARNHFCAQLESIAEVKHYQYHLMIVLLVITVLKAQELPDPKTTSLEVSVQQALTA